MFAERQRHVRQPAIRDDHLAEQAWPQAKKTNTGIRYIIQREGEGACPKPGDIVSVLYVGRLLHGEVFDKDQDISMIRAGINWKAARSR